MTTESTIAGEARVTPALGRFATSVDRLRRIWLPLLVLVIQTPFVPHRALPRLRERNRVWLGFATYVITGLLAVFWTSSPAFRPSTTTIWTLYFHPYVGALQASYPDGRYWVYGFAALGGEVVSVVLFCSLFSIAARAFVEVEASAWRVAASLLLVLGSLSLISLPLAFAPSAPTGLLRDGYVIAAYVAAVVVYFTIALVRVERIRLLKVLWIEALTLTFAPVWLVGSAIHAFGFVVRRHAQITQSSASMLILRPRAAFDRLPQGAQATPAMARIVGVHVVVTATFLLAIGLVPQRLFDESVFPNLVAWMFLLQKALLLQVYFAAAMNTMWPGTELLTSPPTYFDILDKQPMLYAYIVVGALATSLAFTGAVHLTISRMMATSGSFRHLLACFLYIADLGTLFFVPYIAVSTVGYVGSIVWWPLLLWSGVMHVLAIQRVYALPTARALGAWFGAVFLFPLSVLNVVATAALEVARPFRVGAAGAELQRRERALGAALVTQDPQRIDWEMNGLVSRYADRSDIGRRARASIALAGVFPRVYAVTPDLARKHLLALSRSSETDIVNCAAEGLWLTLASFNDQVVLLLWTLARAPSAVTLLSRLVAIYAAPSPTAQLAGVVHSLLSELSEEQLQTHLDNAERVLADWREVPRGDELYLIYHALRELRRATTVMDVERAEDALLPIANLQDPLLVETAGLLNTLLDITHYLTYYGRADFENKIPYLAAPSMILVDESRKVEKASFAPEDGVLRLLISHLQNVILREFDGLRGRAELRFDLEPKSAPFQSELSFVLLVRNQGNAAAEQLRINIDAVAAQGFTPVGEPATQVDLLSPKREVRLEFAIRPSDPRRLRIPFTVTYDDLERRGRSTPFATLIDVLEPTQVAPALPSSTGLRNPYIAGLPIEDPAMFFGREDVFQFIRDHLQGEYEKNILVLRGQRRTGKTSILYQLGRQLDERYIPVILDVQGFASSGVDRLLYWIASEIARAVQQRGFTVQRPKIADFKDDPYMYFRDVFLEDLWNLLPYQRVLLAFDEFEEMDARVRSGKLDADVFPYLRNLMQHTPRLDFLFAGTHRLQQITSEYWSILFNIALFKDIGFMKPEDVEKVIRLPVKGYIVYDDLAVDKIVRITAGQPYFVQLIGSKLVDDYIDHGRFYFGLQDVNRVLDAVLVSGANQFDYLWDQSSPMEQLVLAAMARVITREGAAASLPDIMRLLDRFDVSVSQTQVLSAVRSLLSRDLLISDADLRQFEYKIDLVRLFLDQYKGFGIVVEAFRERVQSDGQQKVAASVKLGEPTAAFATLSKETVE